MKHIPYIAVVGLVTGAVVAGYGDTIAYEAAPEPPPVSETDPTTGQTFAFASVKTVEELETERLALRQLKEAEGEQSTEMETDFVVPFYSQFYDISDPAWKKIGCGVASLAMIIEHYEPGVVEVDTLLQEGIAADAYLQNAGWTHWGLVEMSQKYGLDGAPRDLSHLSADAAFAAFREVVAEGPVIASVYYTFTPGHPIPHLVVVNGIEGDTVYYNDPAEQGGGGTISVDAFKPAWKERYIAIRPAS